MHSPPAAAAFQSHWDLLLLTPPADGPIRPPYVVYCQGGTHWTHWAYVLESAVAAMRQADGR